MFKDVKSVTYLSGALALVFFESIAVTPAAAACQGPGAPTTAQTKCVTAIALPKPLQSWDISWVNPQRAEYYLGDRSNNAVDIIDTEHLTYKRSLGQGLFRGAVFNSGGTAIVTSKSGPNGVVTHGRWVYAGDGDSTLKVLDLDSPPAAALKVSVFTGGSTRVDEMALTSDGRYLIAANNAEDPTFATLFKANGDDATNSVAIIQQTKVDPAILPPGFGLSLEQPTWDPKTQRFYTAIPIIANNPTGCNYGQVASGTPNPPPPCSGGLLVTDPLHPKAVETAFDPTSNTGVVKLINCGPNGATTADFDNLLLGCDSANLPGSTTTTVINAKTKNQASVQGIVGSDEVWFNKGDDRYYLAARNQAKPAGLTLGSASVLGVVNITSVLVETIPQSSPTHSVAADSKRNRIFVPQAFTSAGSVGTDKNTIPGTTPTQTVGQQLCGSSNGCVVVYEHDVDEHEDHDDQGDHGDHS
jgi:hypothetical protein